MSIVEVQDDSWNMHLFPCNKIANNLQVRKPQQEPPFSGNIYKPHNQITMKVDCHGSTMKCIEKKITQNEIGPLQTPVLTC